MAEIEVEQDGDQDPVPGFRVTVTDGNGSSTYAVTVSPEDFHRLGRNFHALDEFVRACVAFLLAREPRESILPSFDVSEISRYFPEFEDEISRTPY